ADLDDLFPPPTEPPPQAPGESDLPLVPGYEVEAVLGRGGMGVVYRARHLKLKRPVALKMLLAGAHAPPDELARLRRAAAAGPAPPTMVQIRGAGGVSGPPSFTRECVGGGSLAPARGGKPQPPRRAAALAATLAAAVQFAHQSGFIHRDLKPSNVLLTADGVP